MTVSSETAHRWNGPVVEVDVRETLRNGGEPFPQIMAAVAGLRLGEVLHLRTIFEPAPLFAVLAKRGFDHETRSDAPDDWSTWFWRSSTPAVQPPIAPSKDVPIDVRTIQLDVRGLEPPEPMVRTLAALETLPHGHMLVQVNVRVPQLLLPVLGERGFAFDIDESPADHVLVKIWRSSPSSHPSGDHEPMTTQSVELDVRAIPPRDKHPAIFRAFDALESGQSFVILNDHDPRPLRYQFAAERPDTFDWAYEAEGPELWRVRISRR